MRAWRRISYVNISFFSAIAFAQALSTAAVVLVGGWLYWRGDTTIGTVVAVALYLVSLFDPIGRLGDWLSQFQSGRAALTKIVALLETPVTVVGGDTELPDARRASRCERVTFALRRGPRRAARGLADVSRPASTSRSSGRRARASRRSRSCSRASTTRPTGSSASPASTCAKRELDSLRSRIVFLPQEGHLFSRHARGQRPPREAGGDRRRRAPRPAGHRRARALRGAPERARKRTSARAGVRLSAGERQLVGLARVALADPAVIVLDEATSSLDPATEALVERALAAVSHGRTVVTIAHRLSTAERADRVAVIDGGRLVEIASHDELVAQGERYAALWASWEAGHACRVRGNAPSGGAPPPSARLLGVDGVRAIGCERSDEHGARRRQDQPQAEPERGVAPVDTDRARRNRADLALRKAARHRAALVAPDVASVRRGDVLGLELAGVELGRARDPLYDGASISASSASTSGAYPGGIPVPTWADAGPLNTAALRREHERLERPPPGPPKSAHCSSLVWQVLHEHPRSR